MFSFFKPSKTVRFTLSRLFKERVVSFKGSPTVLELAHDHGIEIPTSCGGMGSCGTCRVFIMPDSEADSSPRTEIEQEMAEERGFAPNERLACQLKAAHGLKIRV